jgi:hypothetical protein
MECMFVEVGRQLISYCMIFHCSDYTTLFAVNFTKELNALHFEQYFSYILVVSRADLRKCGAQYCKACSVLLCVVSR